MALALRIWMHMPPSIVLFTSLLACACAIVLVDTARRIAIARNWFDRPHARGGGPAYRPIARLGGAGVIVAAVGCIGLVAAFGSAIDTTFLLWGVGLAVIVGVVGVVDDVRGVPAAFKAVVLLALGLLSWSAGLAVPLPEAIPVGLGAFITVTWFVAVPTAVNFIDGLDGLAAGIVVVAAGALAILAALIGDSTGVLVACVTAAATAGFWWHNRHPARIFMGDGGALFLGYMLAALAMRVWQLAPDAGTSFAVPLALFVPLADFVLAMTRRMLRRAPFRADAEHVHHHLARRAGHRAAVITLHRVSVSVALVGLAVGAPASLLPFPPTWLAVVACVLWLPRLRDARTLAPVAAAACLLLVALPRGAESGATSSVSAAASMVVPSIAAPQSPSSRPVVAQVVRVSSSSSAGNTSPLGESALP